MEWHCVHIEHMRLLYTVDVTFRNMLRGEYLVLGDPPIAVSTDKCIPIRPIVISFRRAHPNPSRCSSDSGRASRARSRPISPTWKS